MKMKLRTALMMLATAAALCLAAACASSEMARNRQALARLERGMTRDQVLAILGPPLTREAYHEPDVWYYYTQRKWADGAITRDECTPVVFQDDRVAGWGQDFLKRFRHEQW